MTLVELLVVIVIVTTLVTTAIPIMAPGGDRRALREASRNLNAYLAGAQARAIQTGRPFGVALRPLSADTGRGADNAVCTTVEYVEVPAPFAGFSEESLCRIGLLDHRGVKQLALEFVRHGSNVADDRLPPGFDHDLIPDSYLRPGDEIVVQGWTFLILPYIAESTVEVQAVRQVFDFVQPYSTNQSGGLIGYFPGGGNVDGAGGARGNVFALEVRSAPRQTSYTNGFLSPGEFFNTGGENFRNDIVWTGKLTHDDQGAEIGSPESTLAGGLPQIQAFWTTPAPYAIRRQPVPATGEQFDLPSGAAIDLQASGFTDGARLFRHGATQYSSADDRFEPYESPVMILFSPDGGVDRYYPGADPLNNRRQGERVTSSLALCVGRRELIPATPTDGARSAGLGSSPGPSPQDRVPLYYDEPIDLQRDILNAGLEPGSVEAREITDLYNWLNLDSRWVVVGAQSGSVVTVENSQADLTINTTGGPRPDIDTDGNNAITVDEQLAAAIENAPSRSTAGGR